MTIAVSAVRPGNPGVVPPWLQHADPQVAPGGSMPGVIIIRRPAPRRDEELVRAQAERIIAREQQRSEDEVADVQRWFEQQGVTAADGNDAAKAVEFLPQFPNAAYVPKDENGEVDHVHIGIDPTTGRSFNDAPDVIAHEWSHRIIDKLTGGRLEMSPFSEDIAVHELLADTFAAAYDADDWTIGEDLGVPIRDMLHPERLGHPGKVNELSTVLAPGSEFIHPIDTPDGDVLHTDDGRVVMVPDWHVVAGIPNKAAALIGERLGRDEMTKIYLGAVRRLEPGKEIEGLAEAVMASARELYGADSPEAQATRDAWDAVGVLDLVNARAGDRQPA